MATVQELSDELDVIKGKVDTVLSESAAQKQLILDLQAQIAAGTPVTQEQLDALDAKADNIIAAFGG